MAGKQATPVAEPPTQSRRDQICDELTQLDEQIRAYDRFIRAENESMTRKKNELLNRRTKLLQEFSAVSGGQQ